MVIQSMEPENKNIFPKIFTLPQDMKGYYNFGFDIENTTKRIEPKTYKEIAKPLAISSKSLIEWISK
jgi:hypothetical protein